MAKKTMETPEQVPLSALQHWRFCPRQCGLIHLEQVFDDNVHTLRGQAVHAKVDKSGVETAKGVLVERALPLWHDEIGLVGKSDVVEFLVGGVPYPVEYKHGSRNKAADIAECDDLQLAAQALCLEAMTGKPVNEGALYYATSKRRRVVPITDQLRADVVQTAEAIRQMLTSGELPEGEIDWIRTEIPRLMARVAELKVPLLAEVGVGGNWDEAH